MPNRFDLDAYFERIAYSGPRLATLDTLAALHFRHTQTIPFENLNPFLKRPVRLDTSSIQKKLVQDGRGGYCFEQNLLFKHVLQELGFHVTGLAARVLWNAPEGVVTSRGHMLLRVELPDGPRIADVGFGGLTLTGPIRLEADVEQTTPHELFRLVRFGDGFVMQAQIGSVWKALYQFEMHEQFLVDYEVTNWYLSNHPDSLFVTGLIAARPDPNRRYALRNNELAIHELDGRTERRLLMSAGELRTTLEDTFRITLPEGPELQVALGRLVPAADQAVEERSLVRLRESV
jgi:N-hydroxyarylamine O-acetyltransferase